MSKCSEKLKSIRGITKSLDRLLMNGNAPHQYNFLTITSDVAATSIICRTNEYGHPEWHIKPDGKPEQHCQNATHAFVAAIQDLEQYR